MAYHRQRQDADQFQDGAARQQHGWRRQGAVRRGPQGPRLPDHQGIRTLQKGRGQLQQEHQGACRPACQPRREDHRHHDSEAFLIHPRQSQARCLRAACGADFRRMSSQPVRRDAYRHHQAFQELSSVRVHRYSHLRRERENRWLPRPAHHRTGVRRLPALIHGGGRDQGRQRAAVPYRIRGHGAP